MTGPPSSGATLSRADREALTAVLEEAQRLGFLGPGPVVSHLEHALGFATLAPPPAAGTPPAGAAAWDGRILDLGSGGGLPGLVVARALPHARLVLLDAGERRTDFLLSSAAGLEVTDRVVVVRARAEEAGRRVELRGSFDCVLARSFGPPAVTAECAAPFLRPGGHLVVSEPPTDEGVRRWPMAGLAMLGMAPADPISVGTSFVRIVQRLRCPDLYPRRVGVPAKRPLFGR
jgi:16S rRNA (guanine527-N7)-methyltransferase